MHRPNRQTTQDSTLMFLRLYQNRHRQRRHGPPGLLGRMAMEVIRIRFVDSIALRRWKQCSVSLANPELQGQDALQEHPHRSASIVESVAPKPNSNVSVAQAQSPFWLPGALGPSPPQGNEPVGEDESQLQICREMSQWQSTNSHPAPTSPTSPPKGHEVIEFHGGINSVTILSEVLGRAPLKRLVRIVLRGPESNPGSRLELCGLDEADIEYLERKGAFTIPPADIW